MSSERKSEKPLGNGHNGRIAHELEGAASGALAGAILGAAAGPPGILAGAIIGAIAGVVVGATLDTESARRLARARKLDAEMGITGGDIGVPHLMHPPARSAAFGNVGRPPPRQPPAQVLMRVPRR